MHNPYAFPLIINKKNYRKLGSQILWLHGFALFKIPTDQLTFTNDKLELKVAAPVQLCRNLGKRNEAILPLKIQLKKKTKQTSK